ncbi:hypothetical protein ACQRBF_03355 [Peptoniphilaceae bacterium SGI.131]
MTGFDQKDPYGSNPYGNDESPEIENDDFQDKRLTAKETLISAKESSVSNEGLASDENTDDSYANENFEANDPTVHKLETRTYEDGYQKPNMAKEVGKSIFARLFRRLLSLAIIFVIGIVFTLHGDVFDALGIFGKTLTVDSSTKVNLKYSWKEVNSSKYDDYYSVDNEGISTVKLIAKSGSSIFLVVELNDTDAELRVKDFLNNMTSQTKEDRASIAQELKQYKLSDFLVKFIAEGDVNDKEALTRAKEELYQNLYLSGAFDRGDVISGQNITVDGKEAYAMEYNEMAKDNKHKLQILNFFKEINGKMFFFEAYSDKNDFPEQRDKLIKALQGLDF